MKTTHQLLTKFKDDRGAVAIIVAIAAFFFLIGFAALAIDVGYLFASKNELQNIADAAALAGAGELGNQNLTTLGSIDEDKIKDVAIATGLENKAATLPITIDRNDVEIGTWDPDATPKFNNSPPSGTMLTAVKVIARRDSSAKSAQGPINTFFAKIFSIDTADVNADAVASLTGPNDVGEVELPIGLSETWFPDNCGEVIDFTDTQDSCVGWHNFNNPINANDAEDTVLGIILGDEDPDPNDSILYGQEYWDNDPELSSVAENHMPDPFDSGNVTDQSMFFFQGGVIGSLFNGTPAPMPELFDYKKSRDFIPEDINNYFASQGYPDDNTTWTTIAPVYYDSAAPDCMNPNDHLRIKGFAYVQVINVQPQPDKVMDVFVFCELFPYEGRGGGVTTGNIVGNIPNLVE